MAGLRLVHSWCLCCGSGLRVEFLRRSLSLVSAPLCLLRSGSPVLRFSAPVGIRVQPVLQRITVPLTLIPSPPVVAAVLATCHHGHGSGTSSKSDPRNLAAASSTISAKNAIGIYPTGTDSKFMVPFYPSSVHPH